MEMRTSTRAAGPLLAGIFVTAGLDAVRHPESKVKAAEAVTKPLQARIESLPDDTATLVRLNGMAQVVGGSLLAVGKFRRLAATVLIGSLIPTTYAGHRFWEELDDERRAQAQTHFMKNLGLLGGLVLMATEGRTPRTRNRARTLRHAKNSARASARSVQGSASSSLHRASDGARHVIHQVEDVVARDMPKVTEAANQLLSSGSDLTASLFAKAGDHLPTA
jgi:putative oxidoreductase